MPGVWSGRGVTPVAMISWSYGRTVPSTSETVQASASTRSISPYTTGMSSEMYFRRDLVTSSGW